MAPTELEVVVACVDVVVVGLVVVVVTLEVLDDEVVVWRPETEEVELVVGWLKVEPSCFSEVEIRGSAGPETGSMHVQDQT